MATFYSVGVDVGSTTVKVVVVPPMSPGQPPPPAVFRKYTKHFSDIKNAVVSILTEASPFLKGASARVAITGSGGLNVAKALGALFVQEVIACTEAVEAMAPTADVAIELGGEDAKITYFTDNTVPGAPQRALEQRMNGTCAGGTGSFIDQMAILLKTDSLGLNALASEHKMIYPIASRCGVFAKTDIQPLLNEGATREDVAASVLQAVVNQTIGGLACGKPIRGRVIFLGGPLHFLPQLRARFIETLHLGAEEAIVPPDAHFFVALGAALMAAHDPELQSSSWDEFFKRVPSVLEMDREEARLPPMFASQEEYDAFRARHAEHTVARADLASATGALFVGLDSGSTTTKVAVVDAEGRLVHSSYGPNQGNPLTSTVAALRDMYARMPPGAVTFIGRACATGYGEALVRAALRADDGEIETLAHCKAAEAFLPGLTFVIDIGGQDMKSMRVRGGAIESIMLNEACSSGCGSFISAFAQSLNLPVEEFARAGVKSVAPVDLGTRCTVFMNSRVKQAQKEGASVADISGGIAISIIKNALFKVIRMRSAEEMGDRVVVQGGTFYNDAVLRAFEKISGREVVRPDIAGIMGAYGAALIARSQYHDGERSALLGPEELASFEVEISTKRCGRCQNNCLLTVNKFSGGSSFISGNRCERGAGDDVKKSSSPKEQVPNLYAWKAKRVFRYAPLALSKALRGEVGIPRVLNMYEDYPFWHTFFTSLGFRVTLSPPSSKATFEHGMETIPSDTVCYPAKLVHGHVEDLLRRGVTNIFYPCIPYNKQEDPHAQNCFNCPVVGSYPEVIRANCDLRGGASRLFLPFLPMDAPSRMPARLFEEIGEQKLARPDSSPITLKEIEAAVSEAYTALEEYRADVRRAGEEALQAISERPNLRGIVIAGRPYHVDPEINHGVPEIVTGYGFAVLSEDSIAHLGRAAAADGEKLRVVDQWTYHSRLYAAARLVVQTDRLDLMQLVSFGCGLDAVTADQVKEIIEDSGKLYTSIKIDEINNLGAARIRVRSMIAVILERQRRSPPRPSTSSITPMSAMIAKAKAAVLQAPSAAWHVEPEPKATDPLINERTSLLASRTPPPAVFPRSAREDGWTVLLPMFSPFHMDLVAECMTAEGYRPKVLRELTRECIDEGLRWVHNDACFPAICVIGQMMHALKSGEYDTNRTALIITQTGGCCRATNYAAFLRKALVDSGLGHVPVLTANTSGLDPQPGFDLNVRIVFRAITALVLGDLFQQLVMRTRPYERVHGSVSQLHERWQREAARAIHSGSRKELRRVAREAIREFEELPLVPEGEAPEYGTRRPRVGIAGEIMVKLAIDANNRLVDYLESEGAEATMHGLTDFALYCAYDHIIRQRYLSGTLRLKFISMAAIGFLEAIRRETTEALEHSRRFHMPTPITQLARESSRLVSLCNQAGEGWYLVGEVLSMYHAGVKNILLLQPFGCLPNHVMGRGMMRMLRREMPDLNIAAIDYDPGASEINQINRVKLMLTVAKRKLAKGPDSSVLTPPPQETAPAFVSPRPVVCHAKLPSNPSLVFDIESAVESPSKCATCTVGACSVKPNYSACGTPTCACTTSPSGGCGGAGSSSACGTPACACGGSPGSSCVTPGWSSAPITSRACSCGATSSCSAHAVSGSASSDLQVDVESARKIEDAIAQAHENPASSSFARAVFLTIYDVVFCLHATRRKAVYWVPTLVISMILAAVIVALLVVFVPRV